MGILYLMHPIPPPKTETLSDGCIKISIGKGDSMVSTIVSSAHLVDQKIPQLERAYREQ